MEKLVLIDGNSLLNRAYYATPIFTTRSGMPTNAIFGFIKLLFKILEDVKPQYLIVAFDLKAPTFRHKMYSGYKATRKAMPDDLAAQIVPLKNLLNAMKIAMCEKEGFEADDIIGTLSNKFNVHSYIYTGDRDSFQLVDIKTDVHYTKRGVSDLLKLNINNFKEEVGVNPSQIIDLKALMGDKSDNIPGIPGVGEKIAHSLLEAFYTLDGVYEHIDELKGLLKENLVANKEMAYMSYKLATIDRNCDLKIKLEDCVAPQKYNSDVKKLFVEFEFKSLLGLGIFEDDTPENKVERIYPEKIELSSYDEAQEAFEDCKEFTLLVKENYADIYADNKLYIIRTSSNLIDSGMPVSDFICVLKLIFSNSENHIITYGCKDLLHLLSFFDVEFKCSFDDILLEKYLCDHVALNFDMNALCEYYFYSKEYAAFAVYDLHVKYTDKLKNDKLMHLYSDMEKPLLTVLFEMEEIGIKVSLDMLNEMSKRYEALITQYRQKIYDGCGCEFNLNSPTQLGQVLYEKLGIKEIKKKSSGKFTTGADVLERFKEKVPVVADILKFRQFQKLYSTYLEGFRPLVERGSGIIHTTYNQATTATGRLSSANPNLQNIPIRENEGRELRKLFVPRKDGYVFIDADYSQIELRLLAHFSGCKELIAAYQEGVDIHTVTASQVFGVPVEKVTDKMRRDAKAVNFGIIYGMSEFGLSRNLDIPVSMAHDYIEKYFASYSAVKEYMNGNVVFAKEHGYVSTLAGRKRMIPEIKSSNYNLRMFGERAAMNMPLQGSSADIIKIAMVNVYDALKKNKLRTKLILQVHDELVLEAPEEEAKTAAEILKKEMENAVKLKVPMPVEVHIGKDWYDAK